ncbi:hypothetical protein ACP4OV_026786 [Aristida adscensionis]
MPKLEHVKLDFRVHKMECLNGASNLGIQPVFGIQHLFALRKVEVKITGNNFDNNDDVGTDTYDGTTRCVATAINDAVKTLPNRPTVSLK